MAGESRGPRQREFRDANWEAGLRTFVDWMVQEGFMTREDGAAFNESRTTVRRGVARLEDFIMATFNEGLERGLDGC